MSNAFGVIRAPQSILFGNGQRFALGRVCRSIGARALICTDARLASDPVLSELRGSLEGQGVRVDIFGETLAELPLPCVQEALKLARSVKPDVVVGVGGGSCMDMAKLVSLLLTYEGPVDRYYGEFLVPGPVLPVIAVPTTSGTGSEVTPVAVLGDPGRDLKVGVSSPYLIPRVAICDPELTITCPPQLTAISGADALAHAIEAFTAITHQRTPNLAQERVFVGKNLLSDGFALEAIASITRYLPRAVADGSDLEAREALMQSSLLAGLAFGAAGTAAAHAIQYPVGALTHSPHGLGVGTLMPYVMAFNRPCCTSEFAAISRAMGVSDGDDVALADVAVGAVADLLDGVGIPRTLAGLGLAQDQLEWVASQSLRSARLVTNNPRPLDLSAMRALVMAAFTGSR